MGWNPVKSVGNAFSSVGHAIGNIGDGHWGTILGFTGSALTGFMDGGSMMKMGAQADAAKKEKRQMKKINRAIAAENARQEAEARATALADRKALVDSQRMQLAGSLDSYNLNPTGARMGRGSKKQLGVSANGETLG